MMRRMVLLAVALATPALAQAPSADAGRRVFARSCAPCHGQGPGDDGARMLPGTAALDARYKGSLPAALERRGDLTPDLVRYIVRYGSGAMPMFRKTEISDAEIDAMTTYLNRASRTPAIIAPGR